MSSHGKLLALVCLVMLLIGCADKRWRRPLPPGHCEDRDPKTMKCVDRR